MQNHLRLVLTFVLAITAGAILGLPEAIAQVSLTTLGTPYTQNFDTLPASGSATWTNNSTIPGWFHARTGTGTTIVANNGSSNAGNLYSYGTGTATDRALGSVGSGNAAVGNLFWGVRLQNNTGSTITSLDVSYTGEQWRNSAAAAQTVAFSYLVGSPTVTGTLAEFQTAGVAVPTLDFTGPVTGGAAAALDGNLTANRTALAFSITGLSIPNGTEVMLRWSDPDHTGADHGLSIDEFSVTPQGAGGGINLTIDNVSQPEGDAGTTAFQFTVSLSAPAPAGGVTFDIATADGTAQDDTPASEDNDYVLRSLPGQTIVMGNSTYSFTVQVNGDTTIEPDETFTVNVTNVIGTGVMVGNGTGTGTIQNDDVTTTFIHDVQGNGPSTPIPPSTQVRVEGVVTANFQGTDRLSGFFLQEEDADFDADLSTSEGIFVLCNTCPTAVAEGQRVQATGLASESFNMTLITASATASVIVTEAGNHLAEVTASPVDLPVVGDVNTFYETREGMLVTFVDNLTVSEYFELPRYGQLELYEGGRPRQFTEASPPSIAGNLAHLDNLDRRRVILDDDDNVQNSPLLLPNGSQFIFHPRANGGFGVGTQGTDFFRGGDLVNNLTGVLHWSFAGQSGTDAWRIRPAAATPAAFTATNLRPGTAPAVGSGGIKAASVNLLNYFTTIDTTDNNSGPCGPAANLDCRGADSVAELNRQRERTSIVLCGLDAHVFGLVELENTTPSATITDLLGAVNTRCGGTNPYAFVNTGGTLGTDAIRVQLIYRSATLGPVGSPISDLDPVHNRPPTAQTFDVIDPANAAFGQRFTVIANHFKSKSCSGATGADADTGDGQGCFANTRTLQAARLLIWISGSVLPAAGDPDVLLLGDFNSYAQETPTTTLTGGGFTDLATALLGANAYSYLFDGQLGHLDYAFASASLVPQVTGLGIWHINADEAGIFDYNDEIPDFGEAAFEEKPDGSALVPPRVLFQPATAVRAADHDPVLVAFGVPPLTATRTATATSTSTATATRTATATSSSTATATATPTSTSTATRTATAPPATSTATATPTPTSTSTATRTATSTATATITSTATATDTQPAATATATETQPAPTATATETQPAPTATATETQPAPTATATETQPAATVTPTVPQGPPLCSRSDGCFRFDLVSADFSSPTDARFTWSLTNTCNDPLARVDFRFVPGADVTDLTENGTYNSPGQHTYSTDLVASQHPGVAFIPTDGDPITQNESDLFAFDVERADLQQDTVLWNSASTAGSAVGRMDIRSALCYQMPPPRVDQVLGPRPGPARLALLLGLLFAAGLGLARRTRRRPARGE